MKNFNDYLFRCHMVADIINVPKPLSKTALSTLNSFRERNTGLGKPLTEKQKEDLIDLEYKNKQSKKYYLTDGQKTILRDLVRQSEYGYRNFIDADTMEKGLLVEKDSRDLMADVLSTELIKDDERKSNDWVTGKRDIKHDKIIIDIKSAFSHSSYSKMLDEKYKENEKYLRQMDSYMDLWNLEDSIIAHVLVDTPMELIEKMIKRVLYRSRLFNPLTKEFSQEGFEIIIGIIHNHIVTEKGMDELSKTPFTLYDGEYIELKKSDFPDWNETIKSKRVHMIPHSFDKIRIEQRNESIKLSREYMNTVREVNNLIPV